MEISLVLRETKAGRLVYSIPLWYRIVMVLIALVIGASVWVTGGSPGALSWVVMALSVLAAFYEERWILDKEAGRLTHRFGLLFLARSVFIPVERIEGFRLRAFVRGTNPGSPGAAAESARILAALDPTGDADAMKDRRSRLKMAYITLLCDDREGGALVLNTLPARRAPELREAGIRFARATGKDLVADD